MTKPGSTPLTEIPNLTKAFNPNDHIMKLTGKDYLPVAARIAWLNAEFGHEFTVTSELVRLDTWQEPDPKKPGGTVMRTVREAIFKCRLTFPNGHFVEEWGSETNTDFKDFIEKASTKAFGRALGNAGYGTLFAPEFDETATIARQSARDAASENTYDNTRAVDTAQDLAGIKAKKAEREAQEAAEPQEEQASAPTTPATPSPATTTSSPTPPAPEPSGEQLSHVELVKELTLYSAKVRGKAPFEEQFSTLLKDAIRQGGVKKASELPLEALAPLVDSVREVIRAAGLLPTSAAA